MLLKSWKAFSASLTNLELEEIQRRIEDEPHGHVPNDSTSEDEQWFFGFDEKGGYVFLKDVRNINIEITDGIESVSISTFS